MRSAAPIWKLGVAGILLLGMGHSRAQTQPFPDRDQFTLYNDSLSSVADRMLAAPLQPSVEAARSTFDSDALSMEKTTPAIVTAAAMSRIQQLRPVIEPILREEQVPTDLAAIVLVESGGQPTALSPKGARGPWQFMPDTARRYGLIVTPERDERLDIGQSTRAAARYLRDLYRQFGDWQLAFAAYNAGEELMQRAIDRNGTHDFSKLSQARSMPRETMRYVPAVMDATKMFTPNTAMGSLRDGGTPWRVYADTQPSNGR